MITEERTEKENIEELPILKEAQSLKKNRMFGMPMGTLTRHQRVGFNILLKIAYEKIQSDYGYRLNDRIMEYSTEDFLKKMGIDTKRRKDSHTFAYSKGKKDKYGIPEKDTASIEHTLTSLVTKEIVFRYKDDNGEYTVEVTSMLAYFKLTKKTIRFQFSDWILKHIATIDSPYFLKLNTMALLTGSYSTALFEQLEQRKGFGVWFVEYELLRKLLGVPDNKYERYSNFSFILKKMVEEISAKTDYNLSFEPKRQGRRVHKIVFRWHFKKLTRFEEFKNYIRANHTDVPLYFKKTDAGGYTVGCNQETGNLYDMASNITFDTETSHTLWREMYNNDHELLIPVNVNSVLTIPKEDECDIGAIPEEIDKEAFEDVSDPLE